MSDAFSDAMRGQFDDAQRRLAGDEFADELGSTVVGRVRRRRAVTNTAVGAGTFVAVGAIAVAAMYFPRASQDPASSPGCSTWTPSPDPFPVTTISPDASDVGYDVTLPDGAGVMNLDTAADGTDSLDVTLPDGSTFTVPRDDDGGYVFKVPRTEPGGCCEYRLYRGPQGRHWRRRRGRVIRTWNRGAATRLDRHARTGRRLRNHSGAPAIASPFECGFHMEPGYREDPALTITGAGAKTVPEAVAMISDPDLTVASPVLSNIEPLVPYATAVNHEVPGMVSGSERDPAKAVVDSTLGAVTGVAVVKVQDGIVVAVPRDDTTVPDPGTGRQIVSVGDDGVTELVIDTDYFETCPGVTSTAYATLYAVAGSQTLVRQDAKKPPIYVWQQLRGVGD